MTCQVILEFHVKDEAIDDLRAWLQRILPDTRGFDGCVSITVTRNQDDPTGIAVVEQWDTRQHYEKYLQWRTDTGSLDELVAMMSDEPTFRFFDYFGV